MIVLALLSFSVIRTCIAETLIKLLVGLRFTFPATTTRVWAPFICQVPAAMCIDQHCFCCKTIVLHLIVLFVNSFSQGMEEQREEVRAAYQELREHYPALPEQLRDFQVGP